MYEKRRAPNTPACCRGNSGRGRFPSDILQDAQEARLAHHPKYSRACMQFVRLTALNTEKKYTCWACFPSHILQDTWEAWYSGLCVSDSRGLPRGLRSQTGAQPLILEGLHAVRETDSSKYWRWIYILGAIPVSYSSGYLGCMTVSTENTSSPKSRNPDSSVSRSTNLNWDLDFIWICTKKFGFLDFWWIWVGVAFLLEEKSPLPMCMSDSQLRLGQTYIERPCRVSWRIYLCTRPTESDWATPPNTEPVCSSWDW